MNSRTPNFISLALILAGLALTGLGLASLRNADSMHHSRNAFAVQKSAYGKLLARLTESTVDRIWHLGVEQVSPHGHGHGGGDHPHDCDSPHCNHEDHDHEGHHDHDHGDHSHGSSEVEEDDDTVFYATAESLAAEAGNHSEHHHEDHDHGDHEHSHASADTEEDDFVFHVNDESMAEEDHDCEECDSPYCNHDHGNSEEEHLSWMEKSKKFFHEFNRVRYSRTNPKGMNKAHVAWAKKQVENKLLQSYKMDPLHYGAYNSYYLFLTTHEFGGTEVTRERAKLISQLTFAEAIKETEDPEPYLTGAAAILNIFFMENGERLEKGEKLTPDELRAFQQDIHYCLAKFDELQKKSEKAGIWQNVSTERQMEIAERARFAVKTFEQFDVMIARAEAPDSPSADEEVADLLKFDE